MIQLRSAHARRSGLPCTVLKSPLLALVTLASKLERITGLLHYKGVFFLFTVYDQKLMDAWKSQPSTNGTSRVNPCGCLRLLVSSHCRTPGPASVWVHVHISGVLVSYCSIMVLWKCHSVSLRTASTVCCWNGNKSWLESTWLGLKSVPIILNTKASIGKIKKRTSTSACPHKCLCSWINTRYTVTLHLHPEMGRSSSFGL